MSVLVSAIDRVFVAVDLLTLENAQEAFVQSSLKANDQLMDVMEMIGCLSLVYEGLADHLQNQINVAQGVDLCLNWLLNVFDRFAFPLTLVD
jgi:hypothetical protein